MAEKVANDFEFIRNRMAELKRERELGEQQAQQINDLLGQPKPQQFCDFCGQPAKDCKCFG